MSTHISDLMMRNLTEVFNERDAARRAAAMDAIYTEATAFHEAEQTVEGPEAIGRRVQELLDDAEGLEFVADGPVVVVQDRGYLTWRLQPQGGGPTIVSGADVATVSDGRIVDLYTFIAAP